MERLLVVDDSPTIRKLVELTFRGSSWVVDFASSGGEGVARARQNPPGVILLDFVLPDMRGVDVCAQLAADARTHGIPVVLMSAKDDTIRPLFKGYPAVVDFIPKPFTPEELVARVRAAERKEESKRPNGARIPSMLGRAQSERATKAIYAKLSRVLAQVPSWCAQMGAQPAAPFIGRKLLTPEVVSDLVECLAPLYRELLPVGGSDSVAPAPVAPEEGASLSGELRGWPLERLCVFLASTGRSGELRLTRARDGAAPSTTLVFFCKGKIALVTSLDASAQFDVDDGELATIEPGVLAAASAEQRASGKPIVVMLAELGLLPHDFDVKKAIHRAGRRLLVEALGAGEQHFAWRELTSLPRYVVDHARDLRRSRETLPFGAPASAPSPKPPSLEQLALERVRETTGTTEERTRPVFVVEPCQGAEVGDIERSLQLIFERRAERIPLVALTTDNDILRTALREQPRAIFLDTDGPSELGQTARTLRARDELRDVVLVALVSPSSTVEATSLEAAGFDAVFVKPVKQADLEQWIPPRLTA